MAFTEADSFQIGAFEVARNASARDLAEKLNRLREAVDQCRLQPGVGYTLNRGPGGTTLSIAAGAGGGAAIETHPFRVELRSGSSGPSFWVEPQSFCDGQQITGGGTLIPLGVSELNQSFYCVLRITVSQFEVTGQGLVAVGESEWPGAVVPANGPQTQANVILATASLGGGLIQNIRRNLTTILVNNGGFPAFFPSEV